MACTARHELKYFVNIHHASRLMDKLERVLMRDPNGDRFNEYMVRSLYFDDAFNSAYHDKIDGVMHRDKYRIRIYRLKDDQICLERKRKLGDKIEKTSVHITRRLADQLIAGNPTGLEQLEHPLMHDLFIQMRLNQLAPKVMVDYERSAYLHPAEHVRITFDKRVRTGLSGLDLFDAHLPTLCVLPPEQMVLEVKYDDYLPSYIAALLGTIPAERSAISKYVLCRQYAPR